MTGTSNGTYMKSVELYPGMVMYSELNIDSLSIYRLMESLSGHWERAQVAASRYYALADKYPDPEQIRNAHVIHIPSDISELDKPELIEAAATITNYFSDPIYDYVSRYETKFTWYEGHQLVRYDPGQFFIDHVDKTIEFPRKVSIVYYVNDDYEGGEIEFSSIGIKIKPKKNTLLMFPSGSEFSHSALKVVSGSKYAVVGFLC